MYLIVYAMSASNMICLVSFVFVHPLHCVYYWMFGQLLEFSKGYDISVSLSMLTQRQAAWLRCLGFKVPG